MWWKRYIVCGVVSNEGGLACGNQQVMGNSKNMGKTGIFKSHRGQYAFGYFRRPGRLAVGTSGDESTVVTTPKVGRHTYFFAGLNPFRSIRAIAGL